jgi:TolB-like protein
MSGLGESETTGKTEPYAAAAAGAVSKVFISFASQDLAIAERLCGALEAAGLPCWIAQRDVHAGESYAAAIVEAINACRMLVVVLSKTSIESAHVLREVERASSKNRPVVAVRIDATELPPDLEYFLSANQWLDASGGPVERIVPALAASVRKYHAGKSGRDALGIDSSARSTGSGPAPVAASSKPSSRWGTRAMAVAIVVAVASAGLGGILVYKFWLSKQVTAVTPDSGKSIAVLPFTDLSEKKDQAYFAEGMAEEVRNLLVKIPGLQVISSASSSQFKDTNQDLPSIGAKLHAAYVVEGSVRRTPDRLRVTAQLVDARNGTSRWSETYDRLAGDTLQMQVEIAASLARALEVSVGADRQQLRKRLINDTAYDLYLRGRNAYEQTTSDGVATAVTYLQQALDIDPNFVDAALALAETYYFQANSSMVPAAVGYEHARRAAESALKLDPSLGLAHAILGAIHSDFDRDWSGADREFKQALALAPRDGPVLKLTAELPFALGQDAEARRIYKQSLAYDPLSADTYYILSYVELRSGNWAEAMAAGRRVLEIAPTYDWAHATIGFFLLVHGDRDAALEEIKLEHDPLAQAQALAMVYYALGRKNDSDAALKKLITERADTLAYEIAAVYCYRREPDEALKWLDRADAQRDPFLIYIKGDPAFKNLETDPRFKAFLRKMKLPE